MRRYSVFITDDDPWGESEVAPETYWSNAPTEIKVNQKDLVYRNGALFLSIKNMAFSCTAFNTDSNGNYKSEATCLHGQLNGDVAFFYANGKKRFIGINENGKLIFSKKY